MMDDARQLAAQCWCDPETSNRVMDMALCEAVARRIYACMETAIQAQKNCDFYHGLIDQCAKAIGEQAYTADDGTVCESPILLKVPEIVRKLVHQLAVQPEPIKKWAGPTIPLNLTSLSDADINSLESILTRAAAGSTPGPTKEELQRAAREIINRYDDDGHVPFAWDQPLALVPLTDEQCAHIVEKIQTVELMPEIE